MHENGIVAKAKGEKRRRRGLNVHDILAGEKIPGMTLRGSDVHINPGSIPQLASEAQAWLSDLAKAVVDRINAETSESKVGGRKRSPRASARVSS
ncbi:MAG: hypothetical protein KIT14_13705 [bacterium]|nr:hypothetical protein [bacterium]